MDELSSHLAEPSNDDLRPNHTKLPNGKWVVRTQAGLRAIIKDHVAGGGVSWKAYRILNCATIRYPCVVVIDQIEGRFLEIHIHHRSLDTEIDVVSRTLEALKGQL